MVEKYNTKKIIEKLRKIEDAVRSIFQEEYEVEIDRQGIFEEYVMKKTLKDLFSNNYPYIKGSDIKEDFTRKYFTTHKIEIVAETPNILKYKVDGVEISTYINYEKSNVEVFVFVEDNEKLGEADRLAEKLNKEGIKVHFDFDFDY